MSLCVRRSRRSRSGEEEGAGGLRVVDREAFAEHERCEKAMDASGPASMHMYL